MTMPLDLASQPVTNWALNPRCTSLTSTSNIGNTAGTSSVDTTRWFSAEDASSVKLVGGSGRCWLVEEAAVRAGTWRWSFWAYAEAACTFNAYWEMSNPYTGGLGGGTVSVPAGVWTRVTGTATITGEQVAAGTGTRNLRFGWLGGSSTVATTVWTDDVVITCEQPLPEPPVRGATPGWAWRGTADASASVGWPYTLESIGGPVAASRTGPGAVSTGLPGTQARTLYAVHDVLTGSTGASHATARFGAEAVNSSRARLFYRSDGGAAADYYGTSDAAFQTGVLSGPATVGRHVGMVRLSEGLTQVGGMMDGIVMGTTPITAVRAFTDANVHSYDTTMTTAVHLVAFGREHDDVTARRVTAWLARRYGAPVPAGY